MRPLHHVLFLLISFTLNLPAQTTPPAQTTGPAQRFDQLADQAVAAMSRRAEELKIKGVGLVAFIEGEVTTSWRSRMIVVGSMTNPPNEKNKGSNLLAIAYSKAAEMAETHKDSGSAGRPPMTGETGWQGGLIVKTRTGYLLAAFSGGPSASDLKVAQAGLAAFGDQF